MKYLNLDFSHRSSSAKNIFFAQKKNSNLKLMSEFKKINSLGPTNTSGPQPIIIYKKEVLMKTTKTTSNKNKNNKLLNTKNQYISDGGLQKKLDKYFRSTLNNPHCHSIPNKKSHTKSATFSSKTKKIYPISKKNLKDKEKEKIFSQTVIGGFRRPNIKKPREKQNIAERIEKNKENKKLKKNKATLTGNKNLSESLMIDTENKKLERMNRLVENAIVYEMRKNQFEIEKKQISLKDKINFKKKGYLENNGIETTWTIEEDAQEFENKENNKDINENKENKENKENDNKEEIKQRTEKKENNSSERKEFKNKLNKKNKSETVSNSHTIMINSSNANMNNNNNNNNNINHLANSNEDPETQLTLDITKHHKRVLKPKVNQFEFLQKIQEEQRKLPIRLNYTHNISQSQTIPYDNRKINDSFRHKSANIKQSSSEKNNRNNLYDLKEYEYKQKNNKMYIYQNEDINEEEFPFANKKNLRSLEELVEFTRKKKIKQKKKEEEKEYTKKKKLFEIFKNLSNLKESYNNYNFNNMSVNMVYPNNNLNNINNNTSSSVQKNKNKKKRKEVNAYYIGTDSSRSGSTELDLGEYYLSILQSQQLVVNSHYNRINDINQNEENKDNEESNIYIDDNNNYNNNENIKINNYFNDEEINKKVNDTIKRANELLNQNYYRNSDQDDFINIQENPEIKTSQRKKNKNQKRKEKKVDDINTDNINNDIINLNLNNINNLNSKNQNKINTSSDHNTKEKDLPSLPHTFSNANNSNSNSNPNQNRKLQVDVDIQPCNVLNLVEVIRLIIQRKFFYKLCQLYISQSFSQRYIIAISYFVAICKQYPFKMIEDYCNYKTYYYAFRQLFRPFTRRYFKIFLINCISITKIGYFVESLSRLLKFKAMEKIYIYSQIKEKIEGLKKINDVIFKVIFPFIKIHLKKYFDDFVKYYNNKKNIDINIYNKNNNNKNNNNKLINIDLNSLNSESLFKNKRNKTVRINSFLYESFGSRSYSIHPNSVDNDILHRIKNEEKKGKKNIKKRKNNNNKNKMTFSEDNSDIDINKNSLNCPKMSKRTKINFLNPSELNAIKNSKNETPSIKDTNEKNIDLNSGKKDKIKIEKIKIIKKDDNNNEKGKDNKENKEKNEKSEFELDISAEKDNIGNKIIWEYNISSNETNLNEGQILDNKNEKKIEKKSKPEKAQEIKKEKKEIKSEEEEEEEKEEEEKEEEEKEEEEKEEEEKEEEEKEEEDDDIIEIEDLLVDEEKPKDIRKQEKSEEQKIEQKKNKKMEINAEKEPLKKASKEIEEDNIKNNNIQKKPKTKQEFFQNFPQDLIEQITSELIKELIFSEIKNVDKPLIPKKSFKFEKSDTNLSNNLFNSSNSFNFRDNISRDSFQSAPNISHLQNNSSFYKDNNYPNFFLNESMIASVSASSIFNRTIKDKKKYKSLILYKKKVFPLMMQLIKEELYNKYNRIYENIKIPFKNNFEKIIIGLELQNGKLIKDNYKQITYKEDIKDIIDKKKLLKKIENINKELRNKDNIFDDNYYDKILNECIIDTCIELIKKERSYSNDGEPLPFAGRTKELVFKYEKNNPKKFVNNIMEQLYNLANTKIGLITTNYEYLTQEQLNTEKEKRLIKTFKEELKESEEHWKNLEIEETQLKLEITEIINDQLYNEVMEILEHIALSRKQPELYQNKSIFACEEIPKLIFQQSLYDNNKKSQTDDDEIINVE